jgi:hypothetical protein
MKQPKKSPKKSLLHGSPYGEFIADDDPRASEKIAARIAGTAPDMRSMHGPNRFAQPEFAPEWWHRAQRRAGRNEPAT